jgi:nucleoside-diphosphate kinase
VSERTFCIIKPDAVVVGNAGAILSRLEKAGFRIVALRMRRLSDAEARGFYDVHRARPFFTELCAFMSSGPCITMVLEREDAIVQLRALMDFAASIQQNAIHGSDAPETAHFEIGYFFPGVDLL